MRHLTISLLALGLASGCGASSFQDRLVTKEKATSKGAADPAGMPIETLPTETLNQETPGSDPTIRRGTKTLSADAEVESLEPADTRWFSKSPESPRIS